MHALLLASALLMPQGTDHDDIVINEFSYDDTGTDDREFVELYNSGDTAVDISGWILKASDASGANAAYTIPPATSLAPGAYYVIGAATVPNVNLVVGTTNLWENDNESLWLEAPDGDIVDAVLYEANKGVFVGANIEGGGIWGNNTSTDGKDVSLGRIRDGEDTDDNGRDFVLNPWTPGASNNRTGPFPWVNDFDGVPAETPIGAWPNSNGLIPYAVDPTAVSTHNPTVAPASWDGGNVIAFWDPTLAQTPGTYWLGSDNPGMAVFAAQVYLDPTPKTGTGVETWSIGIGGSSDTAFSTPDPSGALAITTNGNTGVSWTYQVTSAGATLYLIEHSGGGWGTLRPARIIHQESVTAGVNDGWQELRLSVADGKILAHRGHGLLNCCRSLETEITADILPCGYLGVYVGYRASLANTTEIRPLMMDQVFVRLGSGRITYSGQPSPTTFANPAITCTNSPTIGQAAWGLQMSGLTPGQLSVLLAGVQPLTPPIALGPLGGPPTSFIYLNAIMYLGLTPDPLGNASAMVAGQSGGLPCNTSWIGMDVLWQAFTADPNLPYAFFVGNTNLMTTTVGY